MILGQRWSIRPRNPIRAISQCAPARVAVISQSEPADAFVVTPGRLAYRAVTSTPWPPNPPHRQGQLPFHDLLSKNCDKASACPGRRREPAKPLRSRVTRKEGTMAVRLVITTYAKPGKGTELARGYGGPPSSGLRSRAFGPPSPILTDQLPLAMAPLDAS